MKKLILILIIITLCTGYVFSENGTALVIGNGTYQNLPVIEKSVQEAGEVGECLERLGLTVFLVKDGTCDQMYDALYSFEKKMNESGGFALFYFGGHGVQIDGNNYLLPVDEDFSNGLRVRYWSLCVSDVLDVMSEAGTANVVIIDACRKNQIFSGYRGMHREGLAEINTPSSTIAVLPAAPGKTVQEGAFTRTLLGYLEKPGLEFMEILNLTRGSVREKTGGKQIPAFFGELPGEIYMDNDFIR